MKERSKLRTKIILKTKNFWKLINKVMSLMMGISAVEDNEGNLVTSNPLIQEVVLVKMAKIYKGQRSEIFSSRGEQLVKAAYTLHHEDQGEWIKREHDSKKFEEEVCAGVTVKQVTDTVKSHKDNRAPGIDNIPTKLYKNATPLYYQMVTRLVNECLETSETPEILNTGKMTLIDKKEASLKLKEKRPIKVSSLLLSVITKTINMRMLKVCEHENMFGETQYGFRPGRSTTDCILLLLAAVKKAKKKGFKISVAFR